MNKYTIYCTEEQTKRALKLGAPIELWKDSDDIVHPNYIKLNIQDHMGLCSRGYTYAVIPTAEQLIGWLEEQDMIIETSFKGTDEPDKKGNKMYIYHLFDFKKWEELNPLSDLYQSRKEATLAAIDAALKYLESLKH